MHSTFRYAMNFDFDLLQYYVSLNIFTISLFAGLWKKFKCKFRLKWKPLDSIQRLLCATTHNKPLKIGRPQNIESSYRCTSK